ncbi:transcobalamin-1 precursor [Daubentonia madagascariensis]|uniref:Transcobalamin-1 n=1 Tax=Daubentonia madagascariensis TaxID=31869 RepID=A0ABD2FA11_DAUMA
MRQPHQLPLVGLLLFSLIPSQLCETCEVSKEKYFCLNPLLSTIFKSKYTRGTEAANTLLSIRLVGIQNQTLQQRLLQQVRYNVERKESDLSSGQLALIIMALGACHTHDENFIYDYHLISQLENKFQAEIENMGAHDGNPLTNYYQLSLDVLALCLFSGSYSTTKVAELFSPENKNYYLGGQFSVDTGAMAILALTCVKRSLMSGQIRADEKDLERINNHTQSLVKKILSEKKGKGLIGNAFSTGNAMQALFVSSDYYQESDWDCQQTLNTVLKEISRGVFSIPIAAAQILPAVMGKTYLDVNSCVSGSGNFNISIPVPVTVTPPNSPLYISVNYSVRISETYFTHVTVPNGSVFLDVMEEAQKQNKTVFGFTMEESEWGPYITSVQGLRANNNDRTYWELLSGGKPLSQGVGSYIVHEGDNLEVRWSKY